jgi:hypothetical protein
MTKIAAAAQRQTSLMVMGGSFVLFLVVVLISIFIQIQSNKRPKTINEN